MEWSDLNLIFQYHFGNLVKWGHSGLWWLALLPHVICSGQQNWRSAVNLDIDSNSQYIISNLLSLCHNNQQWSRQWPTCPYPGSLGPRMIKTESRVPLQANMNMLFYSSEILWLLVSYPSMFLRLLIDSINICEAIYL